MTTRPSPLKKKRLPLDREQVLRAAIALADAGGIEALSMRQLGHALGVEAMSLYHHVSNKDEILAGMADVIVGDIELVEAAGDWREAMRKRAISMRRLFLGHPWALGLLESRRQPGPASLRYFEAVLGVLRRAGFSIPEALSAFSLLDSYAYGFCIQQKNLPSESESEAREATEQFLERLPGQQYPHLAELAREVTRSGLDFAKEYERGLELILDGLERARGKRAAGGRTTARSRRKARRRPGRADSGRPSATCSYPGRRSPRMRRS